MLASSSRKASYVAASSSEWVTPLLAIFREANFFVKGRNKILALSFIFKALSLVNICLRRFRFILASYFKNQGLLWWCKFFFKLKDVNLLNVFCCEFLVEQIIYV